MRKNENCVENGEVVGTTVLGEPNSFMCTEAIYGDFILEYDFNVHPKMNSGVQIRSNSYPEYDNGWVHGYQVEIDSSDRAFPVAKPEKEPRKG